MERQVVYCVSDGLGPLRPNDLENLGVRWGVQGVYKLDEYGELEGLEPFNERLRAFATEQCERYAKRADELCWDMRDLLIRKEHLSEANGYWKRVEAYAVASKTLVKLTVVVSGKCGSASGETSDLCPLLASTTHEHFFSRSDPYDSEDWEESAKAKRCGETGISQWDTCSIIQRFLALYRSTNVPEAAKEFCDPFTKILDEMKGSDSSGRANAQNKIQLSIVTSNGEQKALEPNASVWDILSLCSRQEKAGATVSKGDDPAEQNSARASQEESAPTHFLGKLQLGDSEEVIFTISCAPFAEKQDEDGRAPLAGGNITSASNQSEPVPGEETRRRGTVPAKPLEVPLSWRRYMFKDESCPNFPFVGLSLDELDELEAKLEVALDNFERGLSRFSPHQTANAITAGCQAFFERQVDAYLALITWDAGCRFVMGVSTDPWLRFRSRHWH